MQVQELSLFDAPLPSSANNNLEENEDQNHKISLTEDDLYLVNFMREIMGSTALEMSDYELKNVATEFQFLLDEWLDEFERGMFDGKTLQEVIITL